jgi:hypothetical protein
MAEQDLEKAPHVALGAAFGPWAAMGAAWAEAMAEMGGDMLHFAADRLQADLDTQQRLFAAQGPQDVRHILAEFTQTAIDQYSAETGRFVAQGEALAARLGLPRVE